jgi:hypothetical protein
MSERCPWYVSAAAVRRYQQLVPAAPREFDDASDELIERAAECWRRYRDKPELEPSTTRTGAYVYREAGSDRGGRRRIRFVVAMGRRAEGAKPQVVDVVL